MFLLLLRIIPLVALALLLPPTPAPAQEITYSADSAKVARAKEAGVGLVHWVKTIPGSREHVIYVRNISARPIQVTSYEIYDCVNLRGRVCGVHAPGPRVEPGKTVRLVIIDQGSSRGPSSYHYRLQSAFIDSTGVDTTHQ